jgi:hypothetical protein
MMVGLSSFAEFVPADCAACGGLMAVEMTRMGGHTYREDEFVEDILPDLDGVERVDHPDVDKYIYANPERVGFYRTEE